MSESIHLKVVTPDGSRLDEEVAAVTARSEVGEFCVLPAHRPILAALKAGRLVVERAGGKEIYAVDRGFFEGGPDHVNVITAGFATRAELDPLELDRELAGLRDRLGALEEGDAAREGLERDMDWVLARKALVGEEN